MAETTSLPAAGREDVHENAPQEPLEQAEAPLADGSGGGGGGNSDAPSDATEDTTDGTGMWNVSTDKVARLEKKLAALGASLATLTEPADVSGACTNAVNQRKYVPGGGATIGVDYVCANVVCVCVVDQGNDTTLGGGQAPTEPGGWPRSDVGWR